MSNTTLMKPTDDLFTDLTAPQAEVIGGGGGPIKVYQTGDAANVYRHYGFIDWLGSTNWGFSTLSANANNQISSVIVSRGVWDFYDGSGSNKGTRLLSVSPGLYTYVGDYANDRISSFYRRYGT